MTFQRKNKLSQIIPLINSTKRLKKKKIPKFIVYYENVYYANVYYELLNLMRMRTEDAF